MAILDRLVGYAPAATVASDVVTWANGEWDRPHMARFTTSHYLWNQTRDGTSAITAIGGEQADGTYDVTGTSATMGTWVTGDSICVMRNDATPSTYTYATMVSAAAAAATNNDGDYCVAYYQDSGLTISRFADSALLTVADYSVFGGLPYGRVFLDANRFLQLNAATSATMHIDNITIAPEQYTRITVDCANLVLTITRLRLSESKRIGRAILITNIAAGSSIESCELFGGVAMFDIRTANMTLRNNSTFSYRAYELWNSACAVINCVANESIDAYQQTNATFTNSITNKAYAMTGSGNQTAVAESALGWGRVRGFTDLSIDKTSMLSEAGVNHAGFGYDINGIAFVADEFPIGCYAFAGLNLVDEDDVVSGAGGNWTEAAIANVLDSYSYGVGGASLTGTWTKADKDLVNTGNDFGNSGSEVANWTKADKDYVILTQDFGTGGTSEVANWTSADATKYLAPNTYGVGGTSATGLYTPDFSEPANTLDTDTTNNVAGTYAPALEIYYKAGETYGAGGTDKTGSYDPLSATATVGGTFTAQGKPEAD